MSKIMKFYYSIIRWDRKLETRGLFRCKICFRSILSRQNGLNCNMEQQFFFWQKIRFFSLFPYWSPIDPNTWASIVTPKCQKRRLGKSDNPKSFRWNVATCSAPGASIDAQNHRGSNRGSNRGKKPKKRIYGKNNIFWSIWQFRPFWRDGEERKHILHRNRPRVSNFLSHRIVE